MPGDIRAALEAAPAHDGQALEALLTTVLGPCVVEPAPAILRPPACPPGTGAGTPVPALVIAGCPGDAVGFIDPGITDRVRAFDARMFADWYVGVVALETEPLRYAALFGPEKVGWLGFDGEGRLIGAGGNCPAFDLRPRLQGMTWLDGPRWGE